MRDVIASYLESRDHDNAIIGFDIEVRQDDDLFSSRGFLSPVFKRVGFVSDCKKSSNYEEVNVK